MEGRKDDQNKLRMDLLPADVLEALATILTDGADRYGDRNWEQGMAWSRPYAALLRHIFAWWQGENQDPDSGRPHTWHALCCAAFLVAYEQRELGTDDRPVDNDLAEWVKNMVDNAGHDPDNQEWDRVETDPEMVDKDTITDCFGNYFGRWCPICDAEMEVVRPGKVQCSQSCDGQSSDDVMSEKEDQKSTKCEICGDVRDDLHFFKGFIACERCIRLDCGITMPCDESDPGVYEGDQKDVMSEEEDYSLGFQTAVDLAKTLWRQHYYHKAPQWEPLDSLSGVIGQIDNMVSGLVKPQYNEYEQSPEEQAEWDRKEREQQVYHHQTRKCVVCGDMTDFDPSVNHFPMCNECNSGHVVKSESAASKMKQDLKDNYNLEVMSEQEEQEWIEKEREQQKARFKSSS